MTPHYLTFSNYIIDDIVLWDGRTFMETVGGSGTHALIGMRLWSDRLGFLAAVGSDFGPAQREQLSRLQIDLRGLVTCEGMPTARAWQLFEPDERRIEIFRTELDDFNRCRVRFQDMPADYQQAKGIHLQWGQTLAEIQTLVDQLRAANPSVCLVWEPATEGPEARRERYRSLFKDLDLVSPDLGQAQGITGVDDPDVAAKTLIGWGAKRVAVRMGAAGSIVRTADGSGWQIPAVPPAQLVDVTGAGNAYNGGILVGLGDGLETLEAALRGAVSASFALEQFGIPTLTEATFAEAAGRLDWARGQVTSLPDE